MLAEGPYDEPALFAATRVLKQAVDESLLCFTASLTLTVCDFDKRLIHSFDRQRLWFSESEALLLFGLESNVTGIPIFVVNSL